MMDGITNHPWRGNHELASQLLLPAFCWLSLERLSPSLVTEPPGRSARRDVDYTSIQDAINASSDGDVIQIYVCSMYVRKHSLDTGGKAITIQGTVNSEGHTHHHSLGTTIRCPGARQGAEDQFDQR